MHARGQVFKRFGGTQTESLHLFSTRIPDEDPILGGPARIETLDKEIVNAFVDRVGSEQALDMGVDALDSDWLGTSKALYYVSPTVGSIHRWPWCEIEDIRVVKKRLKLATYLLEFGSFQPSLELITGRNSARRLVVLHAICQRHVH